MSETRIWLEFDLIPRLTSTPTTKLLHPSSFPELINKVKDWQLPHLAD